MAGELPDVVTCIAVPDVDGGVLGTGDDVFVIEAYIKNACRVAAQTILGDIFFLCDVPDDTGMV